MGLVQRVCQSLHTKAQTSACPGRMATSSRWNVRQATLVLWGILRCCCTAISNGSSRIDQVLDVAPGVPCLQTRPRPGLRHLICMLIYHDICFTV